MIALFVGRAAVVAAVHEHAPGLLAQVAAVGVGQQRLDARARVGDHPLALLAARLRDLGRAGLHRRRQAGELGLVLDDDLAVVLVGEHVLAEFREQRGQLLVDLGEFLLRRRVELRTRADEVRVVEPGEPLLLGRQARFFASLVDRRDAFEQLLVLRDLVAERSQPRRHLALDGLHGLVVERRAEDAIDRVDAIEHPAGALHRRDRVVEGRRLGIGRDAVDLAQLLGHSGFERGLQVLDFRLIEGRNAAIGAAPGGEQRVRGRGAGVADRGTRGEAGGHSGTGDEGLQ
jgi:hypothetical protein